MSTRANIIIKDDCDKLFFYRHSDGYPEGALPVLEKFLGFVKSGSIRNNVGQAAGWLILLGAQEYEKSFEPNPKDEFMGWKSGSIEPTTGIHGDVEYIYTIDLVKKEISIEEVE